MPHSAERLFPGTTPRGAGILTPALARVADGDTLGSDAWQGNATDRLRLEGVDAPEVGEPFSREAQDFLRWPLGSAVVRVSGRDVDN